MKRIVFTLLLATLIGGPAAAQTCAAPFASGTVALVETCNPSGMDTYAISVIATSDSALQFTGLYLTSTVVVDADVDCNTQAFTIAPQFIFTGYDIQGVGSIVGNNVQIAYGVRSTTTGLLSDSCVGLYSAMLVDVQNSLESQIALYPNPAHDQAHLRWTAPSSYITQSQYRVVDLQGRTVTSGILDSHHEALIDLKALSPAMYRVVVQTEDGQLAAKVLVVQ